MNSNVKLFIILLLAIVAGLSVIDAKYSLMFAKGIFSFLNFVFAFFIFKSLIDMNNTYKSSLFPIFLLAIIGILIVPLFILIGLFL